MGQGLGAVQRQILTTLAEAGQPLWLRDLLQRLWGPQPSRSQVESTRRALATLGRRGLVGRAFAEWETYADQCARHRVKVWLPQHPPPVVRRRLTREQVAQTILAVLTDAPADRVVLTRRERLWSRTFGPQWMPYSQFTNELYKRLARRTGDASVHQGRLKRAVMRALHRLEEQGQIKRARMQQATVYIQRCACHDHQESTSLGCPRQEGNNPTRSHKEGTTR